MIDLVAWDISGREIHGFIELDGSCLADALASHGELSATLVTIVDPETGSVERRDALTFDVRRLVVLLATGPHAERMALVPAADHGVEVHVGRFNVQGRLPRTAGDVMTVTASGRRWVSVTDAVLQRVRDGAHVRERYGVLLVNEAHVREVVPVPTEAAATPWFDGASPALTHAWAAREARPVEYA